MSRARRGRPGGRGAVPERLGGQFTTLLDFGPVFGANQLFLDLGVRATGGSVFAALSPRQAVSPAPQTLYAAQGGSAQAGASVPFAGVAFPPGYQLFSSSPVVSAGLARGPVFSTGSNSWAARAPLPTARYNHRLAGPAKGRVYAIGGTTGVDFLTTVEEYNPVANSWTTKTLMSSARNSQGLAAANGKLYAVGRDGGASSDTLATVEEYDPQRNPYSFVKQ